MMTLCTTKSTAPTKVMPMLPSLEASSGSLRPPDRYFLSPAGGTKHGRKSGTNTIDTSTMYPPSRRWKLLPRRREKKGSRTRSPCILWNVRIVERVRGAPWIFRTAEKARGVLWIVPIAERVQRAQGRDLGVVRKVKKVQGIPCVVPLVEKVRGAQRRNPGTVRTVRGARGARCQNRPYSNLRRASATCLCSTSTKRNHYCVAIMINCISVITPSESIFSWVATQYLLPIHHKCRLSTTLDDTTILHFQLKNTIKMNS